MIFQCISICQVPYTKTAVSTLASKQMSGRPFYISLAGTTLEIFCRKFAGKCEGVCSEADAIEVNEFKFKFMAVFGCSIYEIISLRSLNRLRPFAVECRTLCIVFYSL